ncbi:MAG: GHKL domain-containing protein [Lachnospiraceae bacterium]|nr:GHKL domain-containing protein [Lachnospiraceae bacterium]
MTFMELLTPDNIMDTPRLFTGLAEWGAVMVCFLVHKRKKNGPLFVLLCVLFCLLQTLFQITAGFSPISLWIPNMMIAVGIMYFEILFIVNATPLECGFYTIQAFLLAEFSASLYRQLYVWYALALKPSYVLSFVFMVVIYATVFMISYQINKKNVDQDVPLEISAGDFFSAVATGIGAFSLSNLSFIWTNTPFSAEPSNVLYVRTLVDLGGVLMLLSQKDRIYESTVFSQNFAINQLFRRQYEQYKLSVENSEMLRKEMHDLKHYLIALKNETSPEKKQEYLDELEQEIAIQESFQNTGNQVLDVILTNKSLQCRKSGITFKAMVDGNILTFMHVKDICALFGNLLDNAIEATQQIASQDNKLITLSVKQKNNFVVVECINCCEQQVAIHAGEDLPKTTKNDKQNHGFGLKSIRRIAEKYNGSMTFTQEKNWVTIKVLLTNNG